MVVPMTESDGEAVRYGRLTVLGETDRRGRARMLLCRCECGTVKAIAEKHLKSGTTKSCGCLLRERGRQMLTKHGQSNCRGYGTWVSMRERCRRPAAINYHLYGGRGISVCDRWHDFEAFLEDMGHPPKGTTLDRIDTNGDYSPENCRWATWEEQNRNTRGNRILEFAGQSLPLCVWAERYGLPQYAISNRLKMGWDIERILTTPLRTYKKKAA